MKIFCFPCLEAAGQETPADYIVPQEQADEAGNDKGWFADCDEEFCKLPVFTVPA